MADASHPTDHVGTNPQSRNLLLKRNPQLQTASPAGFGALGTRQFLHKQLMTPGSATSASSFEEGASSDGFSEAGTPGTDDGFVSHFATRTGSKQPTKRLSSPSREALARRLTANRPDDESKVESDLPPSEMLSTLIVKRVAGIRVGGDASTVPLSPRSARVTRRTVASPTRKTMRRVVVRRTGADGQVHEQVQYVDAAGQVVRTEGSRFFNAARGETGDASTTGKTVRRVVVRRTGADGQVHEEVQFVDSDGQVVETEGAPTTSTSFTSSSTSTPSRSTVTRRIATPAKLTRRTLRRTGADGHVQEQVQYLDADGNVVETEGGDAATSNSLSSSTSGTIATRRTATPGKKIRRVVVRRTGADGQVHEEVQYMDADGNVVQSDGSELIKTTSGSGNDAASSRSLVTRRVVSPGQTLKRVLIRRKGADGAIQEEVQYIDVDGNVVSTEGGDLSTSTTEETITHEGSSDTPSRRKVKRRIIQRMLVRKDGTRVPVEQYVDSDGQVVEGEGGTLVRSDSFSSVASDTSSSSRRTITRRVVSSPGKVVRRTVVHKAGSSSGAESEDEVQYVDAEGGDLTASGSFTRTVTSQSTPGRRIITRRVVTPQRVVRRMVVSKGAAGSGAEAEVDELDIDAEFVQSEGSGSSDESVGGSSRRGSSRGGMSVSDRIVIPSRETRPVVSRTVASSNQPQEGIEQVVIGSTSASSEKVVTSVSNSNQSEVATPTRVGVAVVTEPQGGSTNPKSTQKHGVTWDYFTTSEEGEKAVANPEVPVEAAAVPSIDEDDEGKAPMLQSSVVARTSTTTKTEAGDDEEEASIVGGPALTAGVAGAASVASTIAGRSTSPEDIEVTAPEESVYTVFSVEEPSVHPTKTNSGPKKNDAPAAGGFWNFFGKSEDNQVETPSQELEKAEKLLDEQAAPLIRDSCRVSEETTQEAQQQSSDAEDDEFETPRTALDISEEPETEQKSVVTTVDTTAVAIELPKAEKLSVPATLENVLDNGDETEPRSQASVSPSKPTSQKMTTTSPEEASQEPRHSEGGGYWGFFKKSDVDASDDLPTTTSADKVEATSAKPTEVVSGAERSATESRDEPASFTTTQLEQHSPESIESSATPALYKAAAALTSPTVSADKSPRGDILLPTVAGVTGAAFVAAATVESVASPGRELAQHEVEGEMTAMSAVPSEGVASVTSKEPMEISVETKSSPSTTQESSKSPRHNRRDNALPAAVGATAGIVTLVGEEHATQPDESTSDVGAVVPAAPAGVNSTGSTTTKAEEEPRGGFWGFFGKSESTKPELIDVAPAAQALQATVPPATDEVVEFVEDTTPTMVVSTAEAPTSPNSVTKTSSAINEMQQEAPGSQEGEVENPGIVTFHKISAPDDSDEDKAPIAAVEAVRGDVVDVPEPKETIESPEATPKSPRENNSLRTVAVAGAAGVVTAVAVSALVDTKPDAHLATQSPKSGSVALPVVDEAVAPASVVSPDAARPGVTTIQTTTATTATEEVFESPSKVPHRKTGRSIWKFWGADKPQSPLTGDEEEKAEDEERGVDSAAVPVATSSMVGAERQVAIEQADHTPVPSAGDARQYWHQQDKQNTTQISYAAAEGATYGPESRFELMPASEKVRSPVDGSQGAVVDSRHNREIVQPHATMAGGGVVTEITQTMITVEEEEFDSEHLHNGGATSAPVANTAVMTDPQQPEQPMEDKPASAGGFWSFLGKKDKPVEPAAAMATVASNNAGVEGVSWDIEADEGELSANSAKREDKASVGAIVQVESIRRSLPSNGTPTNAGGVAGPAGKLVRDSERRTTELIDGVEPDIELDEPFVEIASPRHGGRALNEGGESTVKPCSLAWNKLRLDRRNWKSAPASTALAGSNEVVLNDVSGSLKAREFLVITGPSKDESLALLSCLAGYEDAMQGNVTVNGREWNEKMNRYVAYVMREDLFYETLSVHEHLVIQAQLRMRRTHTDEMCLARVERVIEDMGLAKCRDKLIGGGISLRGITRGERKLLAIATALLTNPSILLVEEPTDELDTFSAEKIVAKLRWLAFEKGLTVAVTLHHPSSHFYGLFDVLYLVADASCVYDGKASDCVAYFSTIGYQCPEYMSPMDYFMLQMVTGDRDTDDEGAARVEMLKREWAERNAAVYANNAARAAVASEDAVVDDYDKKNRYYHMGCCGQLWLLWARHVRRLSRYGFVFWWHLLAALLIGVVFGLVYLQIDLDDQQGIQNFAGSFFYVVVVQTLFIAYRTFVFMPRETAIALRERQEYRGGWYHLLCWYFTKIVAELPALIILSIALFVPVVLLVGIGHGFKVYIYMQIVIVLVGWAAIGLAFLTLGALRHVTLALIVYAILLVLFVAFAGLLINVTDIPDWLVWLHYISPVKYGYEALMKIFWKRVDSIDCDWTLEGCYALTGDGVLKYYSMENRSALGDSLILMAICFAAFFVAFWFLLMLASKRISGLQWRYDWSFKGPLGRRQQRVGNATVGEKQVATRSSMQRIVERKSQHSSSAAVERNMAADGDNCYIRVETPRAGGRGFCDASGITLGWSSLWLKAPMEKKAKVEGETQQQQHLLSDASGSAKCGELVLITGPSDDSNVALLESLGGLQKKLRGKITLNGVVSSAQKVAERTAYVTRDDLFYETLTVEEHLRFQAQLVVGKSSGGLCCGAGASDLEAERVEMVLDELELTSKRHVLIRYLSAADVKLLSIATVLLTNPSILLAEEPTCGMDFYSSQRVVLKLRQLARGGCTVVVTMAHPSSHLYALFDTLYLLAGGTAVYHGKVREAVPYFASMGYQCPQYMSPVDYFIRQVSVRSKDGETADGQAKLFKEAWSTRYSELCLAGDSEQQEAQGGAAGHRGRVGCCGQISLLFRRHILRLARYRVVFGWHAFWMIVLGLIFGLIFLQLDLNDQQDIQNWAGAFFFIIVLQMLVIAYRTFVFLPHEMAIVEREHRSGGYYMICWYLTKCFAELPAMLVLSILLFVPAYLLIGIGHGFKLYVYMQLVMWLAGWSAAGMASLLLGLFRRVRVALIVYMLLLILFVVFGGLLINVDDVPDYLIWLHYISPVKYGYEALMKLFWGRIAFLACGGSDGSGSGSATFATVGDDYSFSMSGSGSYEDDECIAHSGDEVLSHYSMNKSRDARSDSIILLELTVLYFFIGYAFLSLRWRRYKSRQQRYSSQNAIDN